ncbi:MAG: transcriptional regulator [Candidatus Hermodarchaeota archaeon]
MSFNETEKTENITDRNELILPISSIFSSSIRLTIMLVLYSHQKTRFIELQKLLKVTPGKLDHHLKKLEDENYIERRKMFILTRPVTVIKITKHGETSLKEYVSRLRDVLNRID